MMTKEAHAPPPWLLWSNRFAILLFLVAAGVQWNDPDPTRWILLYLAGAGAALWASPAAFSERPRAWWAPAGVVSIATLWAASLAPEVIGVVGPADLVQEMSAKGGAVELGREFGGLAIVAGWLSLLGAFAWSADRHRATGAAS